MKYLFLVFLFLFGQNCLADDSKPLEFPDFSKIEDEARGEKAVKNKFSVDCQNNGQTYKNGEDGFEDCLASKTNSLSDSESNYYIKSED